MKIIAEIGINHNGSIEIAKRLIDVAKIAGADYVKFQKRNPEKCVPEDQKSKIKKTPWGDMTYLDYKKRIEFNGEYREINDYCKSIGIEWFSSVWDIESAQFMKQYSKIVKIPSAKITDHKLCKYCSDGFDTVLMSTGMSDEKEIEQAVRIVRPDVIFHTNSCYPSQIEELNLKYISWLKDKYPFAQIGYSGHEYGLTATYAAAGIGAEWIERHITLDHDMWGTDQLSSVDPVGFIKLCRGLRDIEKALGVKSERILWDSEIKKARSLR